MDFTSKFSGGVNSLLIYNADAGTVEMVQQLRAMAVLAEVSVGFLAPTLHQ